MNHHKKEIHNNFRYNKQFKMMNQKIFNFRINFQKNHAKKNTLNHLTQKLMRDLSKKLKNLLVLLKLFLK